MTIDAWEWFARGALRNELAFVAYEETMFEKLFTTIARGDEGAARFYRID